MAHKKQKRISRYGKRAQKYTEWRDEVAKPYLDQNFGHKCMMCGSTSNLDVDHIAKRGSHPQLKMELSNVRYLCRNCHIKVTDTTCQKASLDVY